MDLFKMVMIKEKIKTIIDILIFIPGKQIRKIND